MFGASVLAVGERQKKGVGGMGESKEPSRLDWNESYQYEFIISYI